MARRSTTPKRLPRKETAKRSARTPHQRRPLTPKKNEDLERLAARMTGRSVRRLRADLKAEDKHTAKIDQWLASPRRYRCFVHLELFSSIELPCRGCASHKTKFRLFQQALKKFAQEHGVSADLKRDSVHCTIFDGNTLVFAIESSPLAWEDVGGQAPKAGAKVRPEDCISVQYFELPQANTSPQSNGARRNGKKRARA
jgi:hypothetical protein